MALKNTVKGIQDLLGQVTADLQKAENGNKAASQRVRTGTIKLEKLAKVYRKESIADEKKSKGSKKPAKASASKSSAAKGKSAGAKTAAKGKPAAGGAKKKAAGKASVKAAHHAVRRPTAKLPKKGQAKRK